MGKDLDPQKDRLYCWEDSWWGWDRNLISLKDCRAAIQTACAYYGVQPPTVTQHHVRDISFSLPAKRIISMQAVGKEGFTPPRGGKNLPVSLHEAAHQIIWDKFKNRATDHGPSFLGVYLWLLEKAGVATGDALQASARGYGLKWRHMAPMRFNE